MDLLDLLKQQRSAPNDTGGMTVGEIAEHMGVSTRTVQGRLRNEIRAKRIVGGRGMRESIRVSGTGIPVLMPVPVYRLADTGDGNG